MIQFKYIKYKNFLSCGNELSTLQLDKTLTSVVIGKNGSGKSTFIDVISYALFGKPFRKVRLGQLINNVNEKGLYTEISFSIGNNTYVVKRGMKPSLFEITVNGDMIEQPSTTAEYQSILENDILKFNYKSFTQIVILGSASFKPFMQLKLADRREVIEDILDISVFSEMNKILKAKIKEVKEEISDKKHEMDIVKERYSNKREYYFQRKDDNKSRIDSLNEDISTDTTIMNSRKYDKDSCTNLLNEYTNKLKEYEMYKDGIEDIRVQIYTIKANIQSQELKYNLLKESNEKVIKLENDRLDIEKEITTLDDKLCELRDTHDIFAEIIANSEDYANLSSELKHKMNSTEKSLLEYKDKLDFYQNTDECLECGQVIRSSFRKSTIKDLIKDIKTCEDFLNNNQGKLDDLLQSKVEYERIVIETADLHKKIGINEFLITKHEEKLASINDEIESIEVMDKEGMQSLQNEIDCLKKEVKTLEDGSLDAQKGHDMYTQMSDRLINAKHDIELHDQAIINYSNKISTLEKELKELVEINDNMCTESLEELKAISDNLKGLDKEHGTKSSLLYYYNIVNTLLKDDGLKTKIVKKFLPLINATVNMYLDKFNFPINFEFDSNFNETIQSNFRSDFSYYSFSEGEKDRIDLALLFTWRDIALKKSRNATNLVIFDEILDGSLDVDGIDNFMNILGVDKDGYNSFIISHRDDTINSKFDRCIEYIKDGHFSKLKEE